MRYFTDDQIRDIKARLARKENGAQIARDYGVVKDTIYQIRKGITYSDVN